MSLSLRFRQPFYAYNEKIYFKGYQDNDTIWHINGTEYNTYATISMGKYKYPEYRNLKEIQNWFVNFNRKQGYYYLVNTVMEDDLYIYLSAEPYFNPEMGSPRLLFDKNQNIGIAAKTESGNYGITDDILGGHSFWPRIITDNYYISVTNAYDFIEEAQFLSTSSSQFKEFIQGIDEDSNPIVTIATKKRQQDESAK